MQDFPLVREAVRLTGRLYDALDKADPFGQAEHDCDCDSCQHVRRLLMALYASKDRALRRAKGDYSIVRQMQAEER